MPHIRTEQTLCQIDNPGFFPLTLDSEGGSSQPVTKLTRRAPAQLSGQMRDPLKSVAAMVNGQHFVPRCLHASIHHHGHAFQKFVTERVILLAILAQGCPVKKEGGDWLGGTRREVPGMRWKHP